MKPHIQETIQDLDFQIQLINAAKASLLMIYGQPAVGHEVTSAPQDKPPVQKNRKDPVKPAQKPLRPSRPLREATPKTSPSSRPGPLSPTTIIPLLDKLQGPITNEAIQKVAGCNWKQASNAITRAKLKGLLVSTGKLGEYKRSVVGHDVRSAAPVRKPAAPATAPAREPAPATPKTKAHLESELATALRQRDHARENGRDTLADIFQKDIDRIEAQLTAM
jgi:hypothetical protein